MARVHVPPVLPGHDVGDLYETLGRTQALAQASVGYRLLTMLALLAGGFILSGAAAMASFCLAAVAALASVAAVADYVARSLLMDYITVHEVIRPRSDPSVAVALELAQLLMADAARDVQQVP